jgi:hypothetical protein
LYLAVLYSKTKRQSGFADLPRERTSIILQVTQEIIRLFLKRTLPGLEGSKQRVVIQGEKTDVPKCFVRAADSLPNALGKVVSGLDIACPPDDAGAALL